MNTVIFVSTHSININNETILYQDAVRYKHLIVTQLSQDSEPRDFGYLLEHLIGRRLKQTPYKECEVYMILEGVDDSDIGILHDQLVAEWNLQLVAVDNLETKRVLGYRVKSGEDETEPRPSSPRLAIDWLENLE